MRPTDVDISRGPSLESPGAPLESVLCTDELDRRPSRPPDYAAESHALVALVQALADSPRTILQTLADTILAVCACGSAGVSLLSDDERRFYWPAIAGLWKPHIGGGTPRDFGPCGDVLDRNAPLLMKRVERRYGYFKPVSPPVDECLLLPFYVEGKPVGTIWAVVHDPGARRFDREDLRLLGSLGLFASSAFWAVQALSAREQQADELRGVNEALLVSSVHQHELTERAERAEQDIRDARDYAQAILRTSPVPLLVLDGNLRVVTANEAFYLKFDVPLGQTQGRLVYELGNGQWNIPQLRDLLEDILPRQSMFEQFEVTRAFERIGRRTMLLNARRLAISDDGPVRQQIVLVIEDITQRKADEDALRDAKAQAEAAREDAEAANRAKDRFLAVLSHELRTPLTPVMLAVAALEMDAGLPLGVRDDLRMIHRNVELEVRLIDDLLDLSRITSGKLRLAFDLLDINELARHVCEMCRSATREKGIDLHCDLDPGAGEVVGDAGRLQQVLWNLLNNAMKFTPQGGRIDVTTENIDEGGQVRVTVRDTGIGIEPDVLPRVFDAFEQGDVRVARQSGGMGLGLAICKVLVEQHRGSIRAETGGTNKGATLVVELPALCRTGDEAAETQARASGDQTRDLPALRVLVVEDHADTANVLRRLLAASGHEVKTANNATDALALAAEHPFDLIVSDLGLPDMTGYDLMTRIKQRHGLKGIAMSGFGMEDDIKRSRQAGFDDHIVKPLNLAQLEESIRRVTAGARGPRHGHAGISNG